MKTITPLVEGILDDVLAQKVIVASGNQYSGNTLGKKGSGYIQNKIRDFNCSAKTIYYLALVDLMDTRKQCAPEVIGNWLPQRNAGMVFRVVVREIESWIMADRIGLAGHLNIDPTKIPHNVEQIQDPKQTLVNLARQSRTKQIREALVPEVDSGAPVGPLYSDELTKFIINSWDLSRARSASPSLEKCFAQLVAL